MIGAHIAHDCRIGESRHPRQQRIARLAIAWSAIMRQSEALPACTNSCASEPMPSLAVFLPSLTTSSLTAWYVGDRAFLAGLNVIGLKRRGFSREQIHDLRKAYRLLFSTEGTYRERLEDVQEMFGDESAGVSRFVDFVKARSDRSYMCAERNAAASSLRQSPPSRGQAPDREARHACDPRRQRDRFQAISLNAALAAGRAVHVIGIQGRGRPANRRIPACLGEARRGGKAIRDILKTHDCRELVIIGGVARPDLANVRFDLGAIKNLPSLLSSSSAAMITCCRASSASSRIKDIAYGARATWRPMLRSAPGEAWRQGALSRDRPLSISRLASRCMPRRPP